jgi:hypothetical protein
MSRLSGPRKLLAALAIVLVLAGILIAVLGGSGHPPTGRNLPWQHARRAQQAPSAQGAQRARGARPAGPTPQAPGAPRGHAVKPSKRAGQAQQAAAGELAVAAGYLGMSRRRLASNLRSGRSLAELAAASGRSVAGLEQRLVAARTSASHHKVASARVRKGVARAVRRHRVVLVGASVRVASDYLGVPARTLRRQLRDGRTLAQIASSTPGRSTSGLIAALLAARARVLDRARAAGRITAAAERRLLSSARARIAAQVSRPSLR